MALKKAGGDVEEFGKRAARLINEPPDLFMAQNASPALLNSRWNELGVTIASVKNAAERHHDAAMDWLETLERRGRRLGEGRLNGSSPEGGPKLLDP
jgi:hypothetical protein